MMMEPKASATTVSGNLEIVYETEGDTVFCWLYGPPIAVRRAMDRQMANFPFGKWGTKVIQQITMSDGWLSIGLSRRAGHSPSQGGRSMNQPAASY